MSFSLANSISIKRSPHATKHENQRIDKSGGIVNGKCERRCRKLNGKLRPKILAGVKTKNKRKPKNGSGIERRAELTRLLRQPRLLSWSRPRDQLRATLGIGGKVCLRRKEGGKGGGGGEKRLENGAGPAQGGGNELRWWGEGDGR